MWGPWQSPPLWIKFLLLFLSDTFKMYHALKAKIWLYSKEQLLHPASVTKELLLLLHFCLLERVMLISAFAQWKVAVLTFSLIYNTSAKLVLIDKCVTIVSTSNKMEIQTSSFLSQNMTHSSEFCFRTLSCLLGDVGNKAHFLGSQGVGMF